MNTLAFSSFLSCRTSRSSCRVKRGRFGSFGSKPTSSSHNASCQVRGMKKRSVAEPHNVCGWTVVRQKCTLVWLIDLKYTMMYVHPSWFITFHVDALICRNQCACHTLTAYSMLQADNTSLSLVFSKHHWCSPAFTFLLHYCSNMKVWSLNPRTARKPVSKSLWASFFS